MEDVAKSMELLMEAERLGGEVLELREDILELNKRAAECREAASEVKVRGGELGSVYMYEGALLVRSPCTEVLERLTERHRRLQAEIKQRGEEMRAKVFRLQDLELQTPYGGRGLVPLERRELDALSQVWGGGSGQ